MRTGKPLLYTLILLAVAGILASAGGQLPADTLAPAAAVASQPMALPFLEGTWSGTWSDTLYAVGGGMTFVIWNDGVNYAATGTIDVSQISGPLGVLSGGASGVDNGATLDVTFNCTDLGNGTVVLTPVKSGVGVAASASASGSGNVSAPLNFGPFTLTGTASDTGITGSFDFTSPGGGKGVAQMNKDSVPVQVETWGDVKAKYRGG